MMSESMTTDDNNDQLVSKDDIKKEVEFVDIKKEVEFVDMESEECIICVTRNVDSYDIFTSVTATSGTPIHAFLSKYTNTELPFSKEFVKYICKTCLDLVNSLERASTGCNSEFLKLKSAFELIISKNPLFHLSWLACVKNEPVDIYMSEEEKRLLDIPIIPEPHCQLEVKDVKIERCSEGFTTSLPSTPAPKKPKTAAERQRAYKIRKKQKILNNPEEQKKILQKQKILTNPEGKKEIKIKILEYQRQYSINEDKPVKKTPADYQREYRLRKKLILNSGSAEKSDDETKSDEHVDAVISFTTSPPSAPAPKKLTSPAERQRAYKIRLKQKILNNPEEKMKKREKKTEYQRQYRLKKRLKKALEDKRVKKTRADYQREYRLRKKLKEKLNSGSVEMSDNNTYISYADVPAQESNF